MSKIQATKHILKYNQKKPNLNWIIEFTALGRDKYEFANNSLKPARHTENAPVQCTLNLNFTT